MTPGGAVLHLLIVRKYKQKLTPENLVRCSIVAFSAWNSFELLNHFEGESKIDD